MATGLLALLDDVAAIAKVAAASLDDVGAQAARAGVKAAGVVIDDAAVTPRYVTGFAAARELPIVWKIAVGSAKNKLLYLLPAALVLSLVAPWAITPLLMLGGIYLCYEGAEKVWHWLRPGHPEAGGHEEAATGPAASLEEARVRGAIQTDFILSAEIMAITLATLPTGSILTQAIVLAVVGLGITALVYGAVALIVKADDVGVALAGNARPVATLLGLRRVPATAGGAADRVLRPATQRVGRGLVLLMPVLLRVLAVVGTLAMLWVGGGILLHGMEVLGLAWPAHLVHGAAAAAARPLPPAGPALEWLVSAVLSGLFAMLVGLAAMKLAGAVGAAVRRVRGRAG